MIYILHILNIAHRLVKKALLRSPDWKIGCGLVGWSLTSPPACVREKRKIGVSSFGIFDQIWNVGPNLKILCNIIFNADNKKVFTCYDCYGSCWVIPGKQRILESFGVMTGVWLHTWKHQRSYGNTILESSLKLLLLYIVNGFLLDSLMLQRADGTPFLIFFQHTKSKSSFSSIFEM